MTQRTPTAEEVLGLYQEWQEALDAIAPAMLDDRMDDPTSIDTWKARTNRCSTARCRFNDALNDWQAAQGPFTFEWFVGRFGEIVHCELGSLYCYIDCVELEIEDMSIFMFHPQRSDIETLVRLLSGKDGE